MFVNVFLFYYAMCSSIALHVFGCTGAFTNSNESIELCKVAAAKGQFAHCNLSGPTIECIDLMKKNRFHEKKICCVTHWTNLTEILHNRLNNGL